MSTNIFGLVTPQIESSLSHVFRLKNLTFKIAINSINSVVIELEKVLRQWRRNQVGGDTVHPNPILSKLHSRVPHEPYRTMLRTRVSMGRHSTYGGTNTSCRYYATPASRDHGSCGVLRSKAPTKLTLITRSNSALSLSRMLGLDGSTMPALLNMMSSFPCSEMALLTAFSTSSSFVTSHRTKKAEFRRSLHKDWPNSSWISAIRTLAPW
ncbi:LOW QUALITY PROTEIN: hypothetical protein TorRG33x02_271280 [Trema orientale]|uniref:Uncharacterized protein n=1 Tax=Trema orientale TaxID=63057 RepID=A0A2P5CW06_TREOI|nr:LOW QUALITY PROTEIN: hypothetical protein TorRG33x02_271280 [Trema orientale]